MLRTNIFTFYFLILTLLSRFSLSAAAAMTISQVKYPKWRADDFINGHNFLRQGARVPKITWTESYAASAQRWADTCKTESSRGYHGESIAFGNTDLDVVGALDSWTRFVGSPQFTQMEWPTVRKFGCGVAICPGTVKDYILYVCHYDKAVGDTTPAAD